jgi:hypothetical protein
LVFATLYWLLAFGAVSSTPAQMAPLPDPKISPPPSPAAPTPAAAPTLEPIPLNDIAKRLENSRRSLKETSERNEGIELAEIAREVEATRNSFTKEAKAAEAAIGKSLRPEELGDLEISWKNKLPRIAKWQQAVSTQSSQLYKDLTLLEQEEQIWELTLKTYAAGALPRQVERAIRDHLGEIKKVKAELRKRLDQALVLENGLYQQETTIGRILGDVNLAKERFRDSLLVAERVPLWQIESEWQRMTLPAGGLAGLLSGQLSEAIAFVRAHLLGIAYRSDLQRAIQILLTVAASDPSVLTEPAPAVVFQGFGESALNFELRVWTLVRSNVDTRSQLSIAVFRALSEAGIEVPVPQRDLRLRAVDKSIEGLISHGSVESGAITTNAYPPETVRR